MVKSMALSEKWMALVGSFCQPKQESIEEKDSLEILLEKDNRQIILQKALEMCVKCQITDNLKGIKSGVSICDSCIAQLNNFKQGWSSDKKRQSPRGCFRSRLDPAFCRIV